MTNLPKKVGLAEGARGPDVADLRTYLARYGYLRPDMHSLAGEEAEFDRPTTEALKRYQRFYKLRVTGKLDKATVDFMSRPRCAIPDRGVAGAFCWFRWDHEFFGPSVTPTRTKYFVMRAMNSHGVTAYSPVVSGMVP